MIPKFCEPLEDTVIAALLAENEVKNILSYMICDLPVTLEEIKAKTLKDIFVKEVKEKLKDKIKLDNVFSICNEMLMYGERVVVPTSKQKSILKEFHNVYLGIPRMKTLIRSYVILD